MPDGSDEDRRGQATSPGERMRLEFACGTATATAETMRDRIEPGNREYVESLAEAFES